MSEHDAFGPNLRRIRVQRGVSLDHIATVTKVSADLWAGLERNDLSRWPTGIYARAYVRAYAIEIGADPETTVDEFCRWFPQGDRRAARVVREQAAMVGHDLHWKDDLSEVREERRSAPAASEAGDSTPLASVHIARIVAAVTDAAIVTGAATALATLLPVRWMLALSLSALAYHAVALVLLGSTPVVWAIETYLASRHPKATQTESERFVRLLSDRSA